MYKHNKFKVIVAITIVMAFVMPVTAFANVGTIGITPNSENTDNMENIVEISTNSDTSDNIETTNNAEKPVIDACELSIVNDDSVIVSVTSNTIEVDDDNPDPGWYDETHVKTIQEGVNNASAGYTVYVYDGTYNENVNVNKQLNLIGQSKDNVIVNGGGSGDVFKIAMPVTKVSISNFTITNGRYGICIQSSSNNIITNCDVYDNMNYGIYLNNQASNSNIMNCNAYNNKYGIYLWTSSNNNVIMNCNAYNNTQYGIYIFRYSNNNVITNCSAYNNMGYGIYLSGSSNNKLRGNTIYNNVYNFAVFGTTIADFTQDIDPTNTVNEKSIYYIIDDEDITLDETNNFGFLGLVSCTNITAKNADVNGILVIDTTDLTISNVNSHDSVNGIYLYQSSNINITNCDVYNNSLHGIELHTSSNCNIINCDIYNNIKYGIYFYMSSNNNITNCDVYDNTKYGIYLRSSNSINIMNCNVYNNKDYGIYISNSPGNNITNCDTYNNMGYGIFLYFSSNCDITNCNAYNNTKIGIYLMPSSNSDITNCNAYNNNNNGISLRGSSNNNIMNCSAYNNTNFGIYLWTSSNNNIITNCDVYDNTKIGIYLSGSSNNKLRGNTIYNNVYNFYVDGTTIVDFTQDIDPTNTVTVNEKPIYYFIDDEDITLDETNNFGFLGMVSCTNITAKNADVNGILVIDTTDSTISNVNSHDSVNGIYLYQSSNNNIMNCNAYNNKDYGIYLSRSSNNNIMNCNAYNNKYGIYLTSSSNNVITNCDVYDNVYGIYIQSSSNNVITNCDVYDNGYYGIYIQSSSNNIITNCNAYNNKYGICLSGSSNNDIMDCDSYNNNNGIYLYRSPNNNVITNCSAYNNIQYGIYLEWSSLNVITKCSAYNNAQYGIYLYYISNDNIIHHNNFVNNVQNACEHRCLSNTWDDGIGEGNYWSDYMGKDEDGNGIGDTPYSVPGGSNQDGYPLMQSIGPEDIQSPIITNVETTPLNCQLQNGWVNITCYVRDDKGIDTVKVNITGPTGFTPINATMDEVSGIFVYYYNTTYSTLGEYHYFIWTSDTSGKESMATSLYYRFYILAVLPVHNIDTGEYFSTIQASIDDKDTVDGNTITAYPIIYPENVIINKALNLIGDSQDTIIDGKGEDVVFVTVDNVSISTFTMRNGNYGIYLFVSSNCNITNCNVYDNMYGIYLTSNSNNINITNCDVYNNKDYGIYLFVSSNNNITNCNTYNNKYGICIQSSSNNNVITNCSVYNNTKYGIYLYLSSSNNNIINCDVYNNTNRGIYFYMSSNNNITNCDVYDNVYGIYIQSSSNGNSMHHNKFVNNVMGNARDTCTNQWDDGSEGNYWDDYDGVDVDPEDGIGDTPYNITGKTPPNQDNYPLMLCDETPPLITDVQATPEAQSTTEPVNITCTVTDNWDMIDTVKVHIDGPDGFTLEETMNIGSYWYEDTYIIMGVYYYYIWANDTNGNIAVSDTYLFVIKEFDKPTSAVDPLSTWTKTVPFTVTATIYDDIGIANVTLWYRYSSDKTDWTEWTSYGTDEEEPWGWSFTGIDGYYEFYSIAVDDDGNVEDPPDDVDASTGIDTVKPVTTVILDPETPNGENGWYISDVIVQFIATDETSGVGYTAYKIDDDVDWQIYTGSPILITGDGKYILYYYSVDLAGNEETVKSISFKIDQTPPTIELTWDEENSKLVADVSDETSGVAKVEFYVNGVYVGEDTTSPYEWEVTNPKKGDKGQAIVFDNAGNEVISPPVDAVSQSQSQSSSSTPVILRILSWILGLW